jgi:hypothetical protein
LAGLRRIVPHADSGFRLKRYRTGPEDVHAPKQQINRTTSSNAKSELKNFPERIVLIIAFSTRNNSLRRRLPPQFFTYLQNTGCRWRTRAIRRRSSAYKF